MFILTRIVVYLYFISTSLGDPHKVLGRFQKARTEQMLHYFRWMKEVTPFSPRKYRL